MQAVSSVTLLNLEVLYILVAKEHQFFIFQVDLNGMSH